MKIPGFPPLDSPEYQRWLNQRPGFIRTMAKFYPPDRLYRMASTGQRVTIVSYAEDGTVTVDISGKYNGLIFEREVFGIEPADLTECDLPSSAEAVGAALNQAEARQFIEARNKGGDS